MRAQVFADARSFLAAYRADAPGCLVLDLNMPGMSGLDLQQYLKERGVSLPVIFLSGRADIPRAVQAVREGAIDFIEKPFDYKHVVERVRDCLERDRVARVGLDRKRMVSERLGQLTQREREVLDLVVAGRMNREIAEALDISIKTVEVHRARLMEKLEVNSVVELVQAVVAAG
jgi:RNA polymerase sigma factor (sigma-70 family)